MILREVEIQVTRHHPYRKTARGCAACRQAKYHPHHLGHSTSYNALSSRSEFVYQQMKHGWQEALALALDVSDLPRGVIRRIVVDGLMCFPQRYAHGPDQGNHRFIVEKALGDALVGGFGYGTGEKKRGTYEWHQVVDGGWLPDDNWAMYSFGDLEYRLEPGASYTRLMLYPSLGAAGEDPMSVSLDEGVPDEDGHGRGVHVGESARADDGRDARNADRGRPDAADE